MSARMETEPVSWESAGRINRDGGEKSLSEVEVVNLVSNVATAREAAALHAPAQQEGTGIVPQLKRCAGLSLQEQWQTWLAQRERMRNEIKRGWELLEQIQRELAALRARMDEWPGYEVVCGKNPLSEYMQAIAAKERIEQYLPAWLKRREDQLYALDRQMERGAKQNAAEQLL